MPPSVAWNPMTIEQHRERFAAAVEQVYDVREGMLPDAELPSKKAHHVFDFENGIRLIISKEWYPDKELPLIHFSSSAQQWYIPKPGGLFKFEITVRELFNRISRHNFPYHEQVGRTGVAIHWLAHP